jgi:hypothetical protein
MCDECKEWFMCVKVIPTANETYIPHCLSGPASETKFMGHRYWVLGEGGFDTPEEHAAAVIRYLLKKGAAPCVTSANSGP